MFWYKFEINLFEILYFAKRIKFVLFDRGDKYYIKSVLIQKYLYWSRTKNEIYKKPHYYCINCQWNYAGLMIGDGWVNLVC